MDKCTCIIFEIILSSDKLRLKEKFQRVLNQLRGLYNCQMEVVNRLEEKMADLNSEIGKKHSTIEKLEEKLKDYMGKLSGNEESKAYQEKKYQLNEIKVQEQEKRLEQNLFNRKTLEMLNASQKLLEESNKELRVEINHRRGEAERQEQIWSEQVSSQLKIIEKQKEELGKNRSKNN